MTADPLAPYPSPDACRARARALAEVGRAEWVTWGRSAEGRALEAAVLRRPGAPRVGVCAGIHGLEYVGVAVALGFLATLPGSRVAEAAEVWVLPCLNPDGYARTWDRAGKGRVRDLRKNARGVDLNRNFPLPWSATPSFLPGAGSERPDAATYRGSHPLSEPETAALVELLEGLDLHACLNLHAFMGTLIPASAREPDARRGYRTLVGAFREAQGPTPYRQLSSPIDVFTGEQEDFQHHVLGTWAMCVEVFPIGASLRQHLRAPSAFWRFNPRDPDPWVTRDAAGVHAALRAALALDRPRPSPEAARCRRGSWRDPILTGPPGPWPGSSGSPRGPRDPRPTRTAR